jgi:hypothetical protein
MLAQKDIDARWTKKDGLKRTNKITMATKTTSMPIKNTS